MKYKKGDITITILVIGVFVVCTLALISFISSTIKEKNSFVGVNLMQKINSQIENYKLHHDLSAIDVRTNVQGQKIFYQEEKKNEGILWWEKQVVLFSVESNLE
jgi:hypothetical protein